MRCNPDQSDVVLHDVPIFKPLRRLVFKLCLFLRSERLVDALSWKVEVVIYVDKRLIIMEYNVTSEIFLMWCDIVLKSCI